MKRVLLALAACAGLCVAAQSVSLTGAATGTYTVPNAAPYTTLGSFHYDLRIHGWTYPAVGTCAKNSLFQGLWSSIGHMSIQLCNNNANTAVLVIYALDSLTGGVPLLLNAPNIPIISATATNPMVLTLASTPFPASMSAGSAITFTGVAGTGCGSLNYTSQTITAVSGNIVTIDYDGTGCTYTGGSGTAYATDIVLRIQRDLNLNEWIGEVWDVGGQGYIAASRAITAQGALLLPHASIFGDATPGTVDITYLRWYSGAIPAGSSPPIPGDPGGDLADWEFSSGGSDGSSNGLNITFSAGITYVSAPQYAPGCNAGASQSFRAGFPITLNGSQSLPLDGGSSLSYLWQLIPSILPDLHLQRLRWSSHTSAAPTVTGAVSGPLNFQLTVTQGNGQSSTCTVHDGAIATDNNGTVIIATGSAAHDQAIASLIGPQPQLGQNPWPYYDQAAVWDAAVQISGYDIGGPTGPTFNGGPVLGAPAGYQPWWNTQVQPGTVSFTNGSGEIDGSGTSFLSNVCNADGTQASGTQMTIWYLTGRITGGVPETGRRMISTWTCADNTHLTFTYPNTFTDLPAQVGCGSYTGCGLTYSWSGGSGNNFWGYNAAPANYYDNVQAFYELYYRSGIDTYLIAARNLADRFWTCPWMDRGMAFNVGDTFPAQQGRADSISGLILRAFDNGDGHPDMWAGLHNIWKYSNSYLELYYPSWAAFPHASPPTAGIDPRETGYLLAQIAYCALWDQDLLDLAPGGLTYQQYCRNTIKFAMNNTGGLTGLFPKTLDSIQQTWLAWYEEKSTFDTGKAWSGSTVTLTNGSTAASCAGSNCGWAASEFGLYNTAGASCSPAGAGCGYLPVLFTDGATFPVDSSHTDQISYCLNGNGCTFIDSNHFQLDIPYQGTTGTHGWVMGVNGTTTNGPGYGVVGWGQDSFTEGILGWAFHLASLAMTCGIETPLGCDDATATNAANYSAMNTAWLQTYAWVPAWYGNSYFAGFPACLPAPVSTNNMWCLHNTGSNIGAREMAGDSFRGQMTTYQASPSPSLKALLDSWYAGMWAKPGVGNPPVASPDGAYDSNFDGSGCSNCGFYLTDGPPYSQKFFGQHFGISDQASWPVVRAGGALPPQDVPMYVSGNIGDVPGATSYEITVTEPTGIVDTPVVCTSSPCLVRVNQAAGNPIVQVTYLSATGAALHTGQPFVVNVN